MSNILLKCLMIYFHRPGDKPSIPALVDSDAIYICEPSVDSSEQIYIEAVAENAHVPVFYTFKTLCHWLKKEIER